MKTPIQYALGEMAIHFRCFARNGRWGTCGYCPRTTLTHDVFPEFCVHHEREDHHLTLASLVQQYEIRLGL